MKQGLDELSELVRRRNLRATPARLAVLGVLRGANRPLAHHEVVERLRPLGRDRATIYRNLNQLTDARLLRRVTTPDRISRFVAIDDTSRAPAAVFACTTCGGREPLTGVELVVPGTPPRAVLLGQIDVLVRGTCDRCSSEAS
ncbi:MAG: transcriptional repressor [Kofleriaceae bacterium]